MGGGAGFFGRRGDLLGAFKIGLGVGDRFAGTLLDLGTTFLNLREGAAEFGEVLGYDLGFFHFLAAIFGRDLGLAGDHFYLVLDLVDDFLNAARTLLADFRQIAHLVGDYREALAMFAGASSFDCGIQRQEVGLVGNPGYRMNDLADLLGLALQLADHFRRFQIRGRRLLDPFDQHQDFCGGRLGKRLQLNHPLQRSFRAVIDVGRGFLNLVDLVAALAGGDRRMVCCFRDGLHGFFQFLHRAGGFGDRAGNLLGRSRQFLRHGLRPSDRARALLFLCQLFGG